MAPIKRKHTNGQSSANSIMAAPRLFAKRLRIISLLSCGHPCGYYKTAEVNRGLLPKHRESGRLRICRLGDGREECPNVDVGDTSDASSGSGSLCKLDSRPPI